jgi:hypothetical protein
VAGSKAETSAETRGIDAAMKLNPDGVLFDGRRFGLLAM